MTVGTNSSFKILALFFAMMSTGCHQGKDSHITVWVSSEVHSSDPLEFDLASHHVSQRPTVATLVNAYSSSAPSPYLAKSWSHSPDFKKWTFRIREGVTFSNGDRITPKAVATSLTRMSFLLQKSGSRDGFLEHLVGAIKSKRASDVPIGIGTTDSDISLSFNVPVPRALELAAFGLYGIVHHSDFDPINGAWKSGLGIVASGPYSPNPDSKTFQLIKRTDYPKELSHSNSARTIEVLWGIDARKDADLIEAVSDEDPVTNRKFIGPVHNEFLFARIQGSENPRSPFHARHVRSAIRTAFYKALSEQGFTPSRSFFPRGVSGIAEPTETVEPQLQTTDLLKGIEIIYRKNPYPSAVSRAYELAIESAIMALGGKPKQKSLPLRELLKAIHNQTNIQECDILIMGSGILLDSPHDDIRFMFLSKEGIYLPDEGGAIGKMVAGGKFDVQAVNQAIWDQKLLWPLSHRASGLFVSDRIDMSKINLSMPVTDLSWIGVKN